MIDWTRYPNFSASEFACKCCGAADMDPDFMDRLQQLRTRLGWPLVISSGYRCEAHNAAVGGGPAHPTGKAADIAIRGARARELTGMAIERFGFTGIGVSQAGPRRFIHLDTCGGETRPWIWSY